MIAAAFRATKGGQSPAVLCCQCYVQVILRDEDGVVLESHVLRTIVKRKSSFQARKKYSALERARNWATRPLPKV